MISRKVWSCSWRVFEKWKKKCLCNTSCSLFLFLPINYYENPIFKMYWWVDRFLITYKMCMYCRLFHLPWLAYLVAYINNRCKSFVKVFCKIYHSFHNFLFSRCALCFYCSFRLRATLWASMWGGYVRWGTRGVVDLLGKHYVPTGTEMVF